MENDEISPAGPPEDGQTTARPVGGTTMLLGLATIRLGFGLWMLAAPDRVARAVGVRDSPPGRYGWAVRMVGAREVALAAGTAHAALTLRDARPWVAAQGLADAGDAVALGGAGLRGSLRPGKALTGMLAALSGVVGEGLALAWFSGRWTEAQPSTAA